jgi:hypothetical protein
MFQTNAAGRLVSRPFNQETLKRDSGAELGLPDPRSSAVVYHVKGSDYGDTIDLVNATNSGVVQTLFGLFFGDDPTLGRSAVTNSTGTEIRRVDYVYTGQNNHALGGCFTTKTYPDDGQLQKVTGKFEYVITPQGTNRTRILSGTFSTTTPFQP